MNELLLKEMLELGGSDYVKEVVDYMVVKVEGPTPEPEIIINPRANIRNKLEYYAKAYNEDLTLKANPNIRITDYSFIRASDLAKLDKFMGDDYGN